MRLRKLEWFGGSFGDSLFFAIAFDGIFEATQIEGEWFLTFKDARDKSINVGRFMVWRELTDAAQSESQGRLDHLIAMWCTGVENMKEEN